MLAPSCPLLSTGMCLLRVLPGEAHPSDTLRGTGIATDSVVSYPPSPALRPSHSHPTVSPQSLGFHPRTPLKQLF